MTTTLDIHPVSSASGVLNADELVVYLSTLPSWRIADGAHLQRSWSFPDFAQGLMFVNRIGAVAEELQHHPDLTLCWGRVDVSVTTHDAGGLTLLDVTLARQLDALATTP